MIDAAKAKETVLNLDRIVIAIKATGGYRYRELVHQPDEDLDRFVQQAEPTLRGMALRLMAAEEIIAKYGHECDYKLTMGDVARMIDAREMPLAPRLPTPRPTVNRAKRRREAKRGAA